MTRRNSFFMSDIRPRHGLPRLIISLAVTVTASLAPGQYQVHQWLSFEDGRLPASSIKVAKDPDQLLQPVRFAEMTAMAPAFQSPEARLEIGEFGLRIKNMPDPKDHETWQQGMATDQVLDRDQLGATGRALYQADFYLPPEGEDLPSVAVLAMRPLPPDAHGHVSHMKTAFYRFGLTKGKILFFSCIINKDPSLFVQDPDLFAKLPRPGWHRFAIMMEGSTTIRCYIDGREPKFSPIQEPTIRKLVVGVMVADKDRTYDAYVDNLSIQISENTPLMPKSPYNTGWTLDASPSGASPAVASGMAAAHAHAATGTAPSPAGPINLPSLDAAVGATDAWLDPLAAWQQAQSLRKPMLLYFWSPGLPGTTHLDQILASDPAAKAFLGRHALARIDVNQLQGGTIAKKYDVLKVPTLLVVSPDASAHRRTMPSLTDPWSSVEAALTLR